MPERGDRWKGEKRGLGGGFRLLLSNWFLANIV